MAHQNISAGFSSCRCKDLIISSGNNLKAPYFIKLDAFSFDVKHVKEVEGSILPSKLTFVGNNSRKVLEDRDDIKYICAGCLYA